MERQLISIQHSRHLKCLWLLLSCSFLAAQSEPSIEFFVSIPDDRELIKYTTADVVLNERFKMICKFSDLQTAGSCDQLWIYGVPHDKLVKMTKTGEGSISENYLEAAQNNMNPTFEVLDTGMRIELDVHKATKALFKYDTYTCRCVNIQTAITTIQLKLHEQSAPKNLKVLQNPAPPYLEEQKVTLSCSAEAWPTKTTFRILANQKVLFEEEVSNSQTGIQHEISIDDSIHQKVECEAKNKMGTNRKLYDMIIHVKASFFESFDVQSDIGSTAKLRWNLAAFPFPEQRDMKLIKDGSEIDYRQPPYSYTMTSINATAGSFEVKCPVNSASNYGKYTLQVSNSAGVTEYTLLLNHTVRPLLPIAFEFDPISPEEARLFFHVRDENYGGTTNYFQIKTWDLKSLNPEPSELKLDASEDKTDYSVTLTGLQLFGEYQTQLRACNYNGLCSPWSDELLLNLSNPLQFRQNTSNASKASAVLTSFFIVIGVCVVLLLAAALFIAHKKYRERRLKEERIASRNADGFATMPSRTVTRVPPPSPGRSYTTLDWSNSYRPVLEFENFHSNTLPKDFSGKLSVGSNADTNGYPFMSARSGDSFVTFQGDNEELPPSPPPIAMVDDEFGEDSAYSHVHHRPSSQPPPVVTRVSRYGNI